MSRLATAALLGFALVLAASDASAQEDPPFDSAVDVQLFEYAVGPKTFFTVPDATIAPHMQFQVDMMLTYLTNPLVIRTVEETSGEVLEERTNVVANLLAGQISGGIGYRDRFQFGVAAPLIFTLSGEGLDPTTGNGMSGGLQATGIGDLRGEAKMRLWRDAKMGVAVSGLAGLALPTSVGSGGSRFLGDNTPNARVAAAAQWMSRDRRASAGATAGLLVRKPRQIYATEVGQQLTYGVGGSYWAHDKVAVTGETFGRIGLDFDADAMPLELALGAKLRATDAISVVGGGGGGLLRGVGSPRLRMFVSVAYSPDFRDQDGDGLANNRDRCPLIEEDFDGFEDNDGCPDHDNDGDKRQDSEDKCPMEAEDIDGFEDDDGCPELDNDKDGLPDANDTCPTDKEDGIEPYPKDGCPGSMSDADSDGVTDDIDKCDDEPEDADAFEDEDGCPELDNDKDGINDDDDQCPLCAEDKDGYLDEDGCPEADNDKDGIFDAVDSCPMEKETINGKDDGDGCPDTGGRQLVIPDGDKLLLVKPIKISRKGRIRSTKVVEQLAQVMNASVDVAKWRIVVVARKQRDPEAHRVASQEHADLIKAELVKLGVFAEIEAIGVAADKPLTAIVVLERKPDDPSAACPAP